MSRYVYIIGYAPHESVIDPEILADYADFPVGMVMQKEEADACLKRGVFPPGLVLYAGGRPGRVSGGYGYPQSVEVWSE